MVVLKYVSGRDGASRGSYTLVTDAGAEIKTAYQAEANAFTDTKNTKLAGIEEGATAGGGGAAISSGFYTGNSTDNRAIAHGLGVTPKIVFLNANAYGYFFRILDGLAAVCYVGDTQAGDKSVTAMNATNFYVGFLSSYVQSANYSGAGYYWVAIV